MSKLSKGDATYVSSQWQISTELQCLAHFPAVLMNPPCADLVLHVLPVLPDGAGRVGGLDRRAITLH